MSHFFTLDDKQIEFKKGETILEAALRSNNFIPHYCYHQSLSKVATCRMCMVDIVDAGNGRAIPKLQTSCSTLAMEGMKCMTTNENVIKARQAVMEFLLVNHPLDCTICDQSGECDLQDYSYKYGTGVSQFDYEKRVYGERSIGSFLFLERNRCIHCTRCVRFSQEITQTHELGTFGRGHQLTVDSFFDFPLSDPYQGNLADICPVGAITTRDFRFKKRAWKVKSIPSICTHCQTGCNTDIYYDSKKVYRIKPRKNKDVNRWWMCDYGRIGFHKYTQAKFRQLVFSYAGKIYDQEKAISKALQIIDKDKQPIFINTGQSSLEELFTIKLLASRCNWDFQFKRLPYFEQSPAKQVWIENLISNERAPNYKALELMDHQVLTTQQLKSAVSSGKLIIVNGDLLSPQYNSFIEIIKDCADEKLIQLSCVKNKILSDIGLILPIESPLEKNGIFINRQNRAQKLNKLPFDMFNICSQLDLWGFIASNAGVKKVSLSEVFDDLKTTKNCLKNIVLPIPPNGLAL